MAAPPEVIAAAREYYKQGYQLVAVRLDKRPFGTNWRRSHTLDEVVKLLEGPDCPSIGFPGGSCNNWITPIDFDLFGGDEWFRANCRIHGIDEDDFPTVLTSLRIQPDGSQWRGRHRYMTDVRQILGNATGPLLKKLGIDIRGAGMCILPPSPHAKAPFKYEWEEHHSLADFTESIPPIPDFLYDAIEAREAPREAQEGNGADPGHKPQFIVPPPPAGFVDASGSIAERAEAHCRKMLAEARDRLAVVLPGKDGGRNAALNTEALKLGHLAHWGVFGEGEARSALMAAMTTNGYIKEHGHKAAHDTFDSGWQDGIKEPSHWLPSPPRPHFGTSGAWKDYTRGKQEESAKTEKPSGEEAENKEENQTKTEKPPLWRSFVRLGDDLRTMPAKELEFFVADFLPKVWLSVINGDGGAGKTTLLMQLFEALGAGSQFLGMTTSQCRPLLLMSEEDENLTALRMRKLPPGGPTLFMPLQDWPGPTELVATTRDGQIQAQPFLATLREMIGDLRPDITGLDHVGDFFLINENSKQEVNAALLFLRPLAAEFGTRFILPQHISKAGMASGRLDSGAVQWHNKSRWRSALYPPGLSEDANESEEVMALAAATRCLEIVKDNYGGRRGKRLILRWETGSFVLDDGALGKAQASSLDERLLAFALRIIPTANNRRVPLPIFAPGGMVAQFCAAMKTYRGQGHEVFESLLRLIAAGKLRRKDEGPPSKLRSYVVLPDAA